MIKGKVNTQACGKSQSKREKREDTFSSSLRFSLRFLRRLAISARRMACSSAVRCFFV